MRPVSEAGGDTRPAVEPPAGERPADGQVEAGGEVPEPESAGDAACPGCGFVGPGIANFCRKCGWKLSEQPVVEEPAELESRNQPVLPDVDAFGRRVVARLVSAGDESADVVLVVREGKNFLGTSSGECDIVLQRSRDASVSGRHCMLLWRNSKLAVRDGMSANGTWVDVETADAISYPELYEDRGPDALSSDKEGEQEARFVEILDSKVMLKQGSRLRIGQNVFVVELVE